MPVRLTPGRTLVMTAALLACSIGAFAQETSRPVQIAVEFSALGLDRESGTGVNGIGVRADVALARRVELEGRAILFPARSIPEFEAQGGRTVQLALGVRGHFVDSRRFSIYGVLLPELLHFTGAVIGVGGPADVIGGATRFALDSGVGGEFRVTPRWSVHGEITGPIYAVRGIELFRSEPNAAGDVLVASLPPRFVNPWLISAGVGYRYGSVRDESRGRTVMGRWYGGGQLTQAALMDASAQTLNALSALGGFVSYRVAPAVYADAALNLFTRDIRTRTPWSGGRLMQILGGVKLGFREDNYGVFGKVRLGVNSHSGAAAAFDGTALHLRRANALAVDLGGVFERNIGRRLLIRFDGGDTVSVFRATTFTNRGVAVPQAAPPHVHSPQVTVGLGWRF